MRRPLLPAALAAATAAPPALAPERIAADVRREGAAAVVGRLWASAEYERVLARIDAGEGVWIALAPGLAPGTDAGSAETLAASLALALPENPCAALSVPDPARPALAPGTVCGLPFVEGTAPDLARYVERAEAAIAAVDDPSLRDARAACLAALGKP